MAAKRKPTILIVEDDPSSALLFEKILSNDGYDVSTIDRGEDALEALRNRPPDAMILDLGLPDMEGGKILDFVRQGQMPTSVIVATTNASLNVAIETMRRGAHDFLVKPVGTDRLKVTVRNAVERIELETEVQQLRETLPRGGFHGFVGDSPQMQAVYRAIDAAAASRASVFILGESGTGKEVCAEAIHKAGPRRDKPFVALNCAAIPRDLIESEVFGHVRGAFTGATSDRTGAAALARGGTLFLDEIGEMDIDLQAKLLRFLQLGTFRKVGGSKEESSDARIICATNRDPLQSVRDGRLREDLYYRLYVIPVDLPPLRERGADILQLAEHFLQQFAQQEGKSFEGFTQEAQALLLGYDWPGNVRQLQNAMHNVAVMHNASHVQAEMIPLPKGIGQIPNEAAQAPKVQRAPLSNFSSPAKEEDGEIIPLALVERRAIESAIEKCNGNIPKAASLLGVSPSTIYRKKVNWD